MFEICTVTRIRSKFSVWNSVRFLCDVHITIKLSKYLENLGHRSEHVNNVLDKWHTSDDQISKYVDENACILISKDQDFKNTHFLKSSPRRLVKINLGNISNRQLLEIVEKHIDRISDVASEHNKFLIEINEGSLWVVTA
ncbi:MAG TPA: DUF5615 family PIN-like protein [Cryomorphaceae bacterium]|nr:DUF5615 family PIN-like protein [Cryomorphaceae bacterium]